MVSAQNIALHGRVPGMQGMLGTEELPETGAFDFFNYLLGLQANPSEQLDGEATAKTTLFGSKSSKEEQSEPLLALFNKKDPKAWNLMFPSLGNVGTQDNQLIPNSASKGVETSLVQNTNAKLTGNQNDQKTNTSLDALMQEPKNFLSLESLRSDQGATQLSGSEQEGQKPEVQNAQRDFALSKYNQKLNEQNATNEMSQDFRTQMAHQTEVRQPEQATRSHATHVAMTEETSVVESKGKKRSSDSSDLLFGITNDSSKVDSQMNVEMDGTPATKNHGEAETVPDVFKKVESMVHHGGGKMTVQLSPPELGKVEIHVATRGNQVEIKMKSENDFAKATLESHLGELKTSMHGQDLQLNKVEVQVTQDWDRSFQGGQFAAFTGGQGERQGFTGGSRGESHSSKQFATTTARQSLQGITARTAFNTVGAARGGVDIRI